MYNSQKEGCLSELSKLSENELLQVTTVPASVFDNLPFEIQLKFMCFAKCSELSYEIQKKDLSLDYILKVYIAIYFYFQALELFSNTLADWKNALKISSELNMYS